MMLRKLVKFTTAAMIVVERLQLLRLHYLAAHVGEAVTTGSARLECSRTLRLVPLLNLIIPNPVHLLLLHLVGGLLLKATTVFPAEGLTLHGCACKAIDL